MIIYFYPTFAKENLKQSHHLRLLQLYCSSFDELAECSGGCFNVDHRVVGSFEPFSEEVLVELGKFRRFK